MMMVMKREPRPTSWNGPPYLQPRAILEKLFVVTLLICILVQCRVSCERVAMRVLEQPGARNGYFGEDDVGAFNEVNPHMKVRAKPAPFSGPPQLKRLQGKCFSTVIKNYKYQLCPFSNMTQHEQGFNYNAYNGILGVWQDWEITNNTFVSMKFGEGDTCGQKQRTAKVTLTCGSRNAVVNVTEDLTCFYSVLMTSPLVCHRQSMLVYPVLVDRHRLMWDRVETAFVNDILTPKGYEKALGDIFRGAGLQLSDAAKKALAVNDSGSAHSHSRPFSHLDTCNREFTDLKRQVEELRSLVHKGDTQNGSEIMKSAQDIHAVKNEDDAKVDGNIGEDNVMHDNENLEPVKDSDDGMLANRGEQVDDRNEDDVKKIEEINLAKDEPADPKADLDQLQNDKEDYDNDKLEVRGKVEGAKIRANANEREDYDERKDGNDGENDDRNILDHVVQDVRNDLKKAEELERNLQYRKVENIRGL